MKICLLTRHRAALVTALSVASFTLSSAHAAGEAETIRVEGNTLAQDTFTNGVTDDVILNFDDFFTIPPSEEMSAPETDDFFSESFTTDDNIQVLSWLTAGGLNNQIYTFNGSISDYKAEVDNEMYGYIVHLAKSINQSYVFNGDMSDFSGDIGSLYGNLELSFGGGSTRDAAARENISGTGSISLWDTNDGETMAKGKSLTYNIARVESSITNSSIVAKRLNFNGGENTTYNVSSWINVGSLSSNGATINMQEGAALKVSIMAVNSSALNVSFADNTELSLLNGSALGDIAVSPSAELNLNLKLGEMPSLSIGDLTLENGASINIRTQITDFLTAGTSYTLIDAQNDLTAYSLSFFNLQILGFTPSHELSIMQDKLILTILQDSQKLTWAGGSGTWSSEATCWADPTTSFRTTDSVSFSNSEAGTTDVISIEGYLAPSSITVEGVGDTTFAGSGIIIGDTSLIKDGEGVLTLENRIDYTGSTTVKAGTLVVAITDANLGNSFHLGAGTTLRLEDGVKTRIARNSETYYRTAEDYTIELGAGASLYDNAILKLAGGTTTVKNSNSDIWGHYDIQGLEMGANAYGEGATFNVEAGAYVTVLGEAMISHDANASGSFMLSEQAGTINTVNISGILLIETGIANGEGKGVINIKDGGTLFMEQGLAAMSQLASKEAITINLESDGWLIVSNKNTEALAGMQGSLTTPTVNVASGARISGGEDGLTIIEETLHYAAGARVNYEFRDSSQTLQLDQSLNLAGINIKGTGTLQLSGTTNRAEILSMEKTGATVSTVNLSAGGITILGKEGGNALITAKASDASVSSETFHKVSLKNATVSADATARAATTLTIRDSNFENVSFSGVELFSSYGSNTLTNVTLNEVVLKYDSARRVKFTLSGNMEIINSTLHVDNFNLAADTKMTYKNATLTGGITVKPRADLTFITLEGGHAKDVQTWSIEGIAHLINGASGTLTLELGELTGFAPDEQFAAFTLDGVTDLDKLWFHDITLNYNVSGADYSYKALGFVKDAGGNIVLYIPEPSTATLSLLALAGLLSRRRRKAA